MLKDLKDSKEKNQSNKLDTLFIRVFIAILFLEILPLVGHLLLSKESGSSRGNIKNQNSGVKRNEATILRPGYPGMSDLYKKDFEN